jgi:mRNA-degrading endonuclease RelE of RelBE toxin-antitoxin system
MFRVFFTSRADKKLTELPQELKQRIYNELKVLSENPFLHPQVRKVEGTKFGYRLRLGRWRILFALFSEEKRIEVVDIFIRKGKEDYNKRKHLLR